MESAHLTKAHEHVRNAATATFGNSIATAGTEHELAASAFHDAAEDTHNAEALRILSLLEGHHHRLATLIKEPPRKKAKERVTTSEDPEAATTSPPPKGSASRTASPSTTSPTRAPSRRRLPQSSIASNLAEKRGIPGARRSTPSNAPVSVTNALAGRNETPSTPVRDLLERQSRQAEASKRNDSSARDEAPARQEVTSPSDEGFRRFYSAFGGVISAISAPLAFTSLPLNPISPTSAADAPPSPTKEKGNKSTTQSPEAPRTVRSSIPDLASLISKPALRALQEDGSAPLGPFANNESFYFVPTSGGTTSYASILQAQNAQHHAAQNPHLHSINEGEIENSGSGLKGSSHEEFVDARESVAPPSPTAPRHQNPRSRGKTNTAAVTTARTIAAGHGTGRKTMEELALENETLKTLVDKQSKRLSMWETTSQSSYNALAQSFRARSGPRPGSDPSALAQAFSTTGSTSNSNSHSHAIPAPLSPSIIPTTVTTTTPASPSSPPPSPLVAHQRIADLEAQIASQTAQISALASDKAQLARQSEKHALVLGRYREQWERLKAGARRKEVERRERAVGGVGAGAGEAKGKAKGKEEAEGDGDGGEEDVVEAEEPGFGKA
ncbi:hypothetical protein BDV95DRAFT_486990 [Massariosphaeria phaeospora]|uniref:Uncharacterized protein n=1 Tax=Massariosphaeria phaeospora TaxID=100035 RepID=A0A7C8MK48_9PLEO|nr:hypothetical protein BDV95DRAFT_486990 [Massariosphaeria phaeospora]